MYLIQKLISFYSLLLIITSCGDFSGSVEPNKSALEENRNDGDSIPLGPTPAEGHRARDLGENRFSIEGDDFNIRITFYLDQEETEWKEDGGHFRVDILNKNEDKNNIFDPYRLQFFVPGFKTNGRYLRLAKKSYGRNCEKGVPGTDSCQFFVEYDQIGQYTEFVNGFADIHIFYGIDGGLERSDELGFLTTTIYIESLDERFKEKEEEPTEERNLVRSQITIKKDSAFSSTTIELLKDGLMDLDTPIGRDGENTVQDCLDLNGEIARFKDGSSNGEDALYTYLFCRVSLAKFNKSGSPRQTAFSPTLLCGGGLRPVSFVGGRDLVETNYFNYSEEKYLNEGTRFQSHTYKGVKGFVDLSESVSGRVCIKQNWSRTKCKEWRTYYAQPVYSYCM